MAASIPESRVLHLYQCAGLCGRQYSGVEGASVCEDCVAGKYSGVGASSYQLRTVRLGSTAQLLGQLLRLLVSLVLLVHIQR